MRTDANAHADGRDTPEWGVGAVGPQHWAGRSASAPSEAGEGTGPRVTQSTVPRWDPRVRSAIVRRASALKRLRQP